MQIFAALADPFSWAAAWGKTITDLNIIGGWFSNNRMNAITNNSQSNYWTPCPVAAVPVSGNDVYLKIKSTVGNIYTPAPSVSGINGSIHKFINSRNAAGKIIFSVGWIPVLIS